jgi:hypothetical protein
MPAYREPIERAARNDSNELVVSAVDGGTHRSALVLFQLIGLPAFVAYGANEFIGGYAAWPAFVLTVFATYFWWRGSKRRGRVVLRVDGDALSVTMHDGVFRTRTLATTLDDLRDVTLDTKTIRRVNEGSALVPQAALISTTVGGAVDRSRIVLVTDDETTPLFLEDVAHMEATEHISKIRVFLRRAGWTPMEERPE